MPGGDRKGADVVADAAVARRDEVGERQVRLAVRHLLLLAQHVEAQDLGAVGPFRAIQHDVVAVGVRRPEAVDAARRDQPLADDAIEQRAGVLVELARRGAVLRMIEDGREASLQLPRREEERPVDVRHQVFEPARRPAAARR